MAQCLSTAHLAPRDTGCSSSPPWLDLTQLAQVEITSEDPAFPIEAALLPGLHPGWRAAHPGAQVIRLVFDAPHDLHQVRIVFAEAHHARTQECVVRWSADGGQSFGEIVRQQYHLSPPGTIAEVEDYPLQCARATTFELHLVPDMQSGSACTTLQALRLR